MSHITIVVEGGARGIPNGKDLTTRCREGFSKLLLNCGLEDRSFKVIPGGSRSQAFSFFKKQLIGSKKSPNSFVALLIDSEDPLEDLDAPWEHLRRRPGDQWERPKGCTNEQVFFMATCMETWILSDRDLLKSKFGPKLQLSALPPLVEMEGRNRHTLLGQLERATRNCSEQYSKGKLSFELLGSLSPPSLEMHLPSFVRMQRILREKR